MTEREMLELAAKAGAPKAHGLTQGWRYSKNGRHGEGMYAASDRTELRFWNPLTDDGDALRLAVLLKITPNIDGNLTDAEWSYRLSAESEMHGGFATEAHLDDPYAATRRAIVRAAAAIGEAMP